MFPSANYVLFLNYDDFWMDIQMKTERSRITRVGFFRAMIVTVWQWNQLLDS